ISPWAAYQLEVVHAGKGPAVQGLWTKPEASDVHAMAGQNVNVLWGCDMEEIQPQFLIRELAALNPGDSKLEQMVELTKDGYSRKMAPALMELAKASKGERDVERNDISLRQNLLATLEIEQNRSG